MTAKQTVKMVLNRIGLLGYVSYLYQGHLKGFCVGRYLHNLRYLIRGAPDGLPIPPVSLIWLSIGSVEIPAFFETGSAHVHDLIIPLLERNGLSMQDFSVVLDFGCGCGRIMRYWQSLEGVELWGVDYNRAMIEWCQQHLGFARFQVSQLSPPLQCEAEKFDFAYARSVFTHLAERLQCAWLRELNRVLKPGGIFLSTLNGDVYTDLLAADELARYRTGHLVVRQQEFEGQNACAAFHPSEYVYKQWSQQGFEVVDFVPGGQIRYALQDTYLARRQA